MNKEFENLKVVSKRSSIISIVGVLIAVISMAFLFLDARNSDKVANSVIEANAPSNSNLRIEYFYVGDKEISDSGRHFSCSESSTNLAELMCGDNSDVVALKQYKAISGGQCGYSYYAATCSN